MEHQAHSVAIEKTTSGVTLCREAPFSKASLEMAALTVAYLALASAALLGSATVDAAETPKLQILDKPIRFVQEDPSLGKQYHKKQYEMRDGKLCPVDTFGNREYHKPCMVPTKN